MNEIRNKLESNALFDAGAFGNKLPSWGSLAEMLASDYRGLVCIRYRKPGSPWLRYGVPFAEVPELLREFQNTGARPELFSFIAMGPLGPGWRLFQGEVQRSENYYDLTYSHWHGPMREALAKDAQYTWGAEAVALLRRYMCPSSYEDLQALFDRWPDSAVEFTCYNRPLGTIPNRNTIFWEVRNY